MGVTPDITDRGKRILTASFRRLRSKLPFVPELSDEEFLAGYKGKKLKRYQDAIDSLEREALSESDARVAGFVKAEKFDPTAKENPDPRMIQSRSPRYNVVVGKFLKPMEKELYRIKTPRGTRLIFKGLNSLQRGRLMLKKWSRFRRPIWKPGDCKRWDRHLKKWVLQQEHRTFRRMNPSPRLARALELQCRNKVRTSKGVRYVVEGNRMSGDMNTASGNCLDASAMIAGAAAEVGLEDWDAADDGDDMGMMVEEENEGLVDRFPEMFLEFGQELDMGPAIRDIHDIEFCQCRWMFGPRGPQMVRNWKRVLSRDCCGTRHWTDPNIARDMLYAVGMSNLAESAGIPILQSFALRCIELSSGKMPKAAYSEEDILMRYQQELKSWHGPVIPLDVTLETRMEFWRAWKVDLETQTDIEARIANWNPIVDEYDTIKVERDNLWRDETPPDLLIPEL